MKKIAYYTLILLVLISLAGCAKNNTALPLTGSTPSAIDSTATGSITGKLSPSWAADLVIAVSATPNRIDSARAKLDSSGAFRITGLRTGPYRIMFASDAGAGLAAPDSTVTVLAGQNFDMGTVTFKAINGVDLGLITGKVSPAKATVSVQVTDINGNLKYSGVPDSAGNFRIVGVNPGTYRVGCISAVGYNAPSPVVLTVVAWQNTPAGTLVCTPASYAKKSIDTIPGDFFLSTVQQYNDFINRANADSAIVFTGSLYIANPSLTPDQIAALDKIIAVKQTLSISTGDATVMSFRSLNDVGKLLVVTSAKLTSLNVRALKTAGGMELRSCPALGSLDLGSLKQFSGNLSLYNTGFKDLTVFKDVPYQPLNVIIAGNEQLTSLRGLNFAIDSLYRCTISSNPLLTTLDGLQGLKRFKDETLISGNATLQSLTGLENINVAKRLTLTSNPQLNLICPAKSLLTLLKNAPAYQEYYYDADFTRRIRTVQPLVASGNGAYATLADLVTAIGKCP